MPNVTAEIKGLNELRTKLHSLGPELARRIMNSALQAVAPVLGEALRANTPRSLEDAAHLQDDISTEVEIAPSGTSGIAKAGFGKEAHKAFFVEFGHRQVTHKPELKEVKHIPAHPFARRASESSKETALNAALEAARAEIEQIK